VTWPSVNATCRTFIETLRPTLQQTFNDDDPDKWMKFCERHVIMDEADPEFYRQKKPRLKPM